MLDQLSGQPMIQSSWYVKLTMMVEFTQFGIRSKSFRDQRLWVNTPCSNRTSQEAGGNSPPLLFSLGTRAGSHRSYQHPPTTHFWRNFSKCPVFFFFQAKETSLATPTKRSRNMFNKAQVSSVDWYRPPDTCEYTLGPESLYMPIWESRSLVKPIVQPGLGTDDPFNPDKVTMVLVEGDAVCPSPPSQVHRPVSWLCLWCLSLQDSSQ